MALLEGFPAAAFPTITAEQGRALDRIAVEKCFVDIEQLMEIAGRVCARVANEVFHGKRVIALAGSGGNGGDALVAARHLHNWGVPVMVALSKAEDSFPPLTMHHLRAVRAAGIKVIKGLPTEEQAEGAVILDGLLGFGVTDAPHGQTAKLIEWANESGLPIIAIDVPSGLDATTGQTPGVCINATLTLALSAPKAGLAVAPEAGEIGVLDIGVPARAWKDLRIKFGTPFREHTIVRWER